MSSVLWDIAKDSKGRTYWISDECEEQLYCMECNGGMIPVRGDIKQHHFRHRVEGNCSASKESALHWSMKYRIHKAAEMIGKSEVEKGINGFIADVRFEDEWAFEVVVTNPPSDEKMIALKEKLVIFEAEHFDSEITPRVGVETLEETVSQISVQIIQGATKGRNFLVCPICRRAKGEQSTFKSEGICMSCDFNRWWKKRELRR